MTRRAADVSQNPLFIKLPLKFPGPPSAHSGPPRPAIPGHVRYLGILSSLVFYAKIRRD